MPSTYSSNLKIELMSTGENSGTWGNITNTNLGTAMEQAVVGYGVVDYVADANLTISITNSNSAQAARALVLNVTSSFGSLTQTRELVVPTIEKQYIVQNNTTGGQSLTVKTSAGTGITVPNGRKAHLYVDGTNVIQMFDFVDINGGTIDGTPIGGSSAAAGSFTTLGASGAATFNGSVTLGDAAADLLTFNGTINSHLLFTDNTYDIGANGATRPRNLFLAGAATIGGNLSVGGTLTLTGGVNLNGNVTVGDNASDTLTINSTITSNLLFTDNTYDIGASGATRPRNLFLAGNATIGGNQTLTGSLTVDSTTDSSSTTTGSIQTDGGLGVAKKLFVGLDANIYGITVGRGAGAVSSNTAVGASALAANTTGARNTVVGAAAGVTMSTADSVTAVGYGALNANTGSSNTGIGEYALQANSSGANNTSLGFRSLYSNTTASNNTAVGHQAAYSNTTGTRNIAIGQQALYLNTTANNNVAIGNTTLYNNTTGTANTGVGYEALNANSTGSYNTALGMDALVSNTTASGNTAVGYQAGYSNTTGDYFTAVGFEAGLSTTTATRVTAVGSQALRANTTGRNTAFGWAALYTNTTGTTNTALGDAALYSATTADGNTAVGYGALLLNTTGASNVALGQNALRANTTASSNTAVGYQSMYTNQTGGAHTALGYQAMYNMTQGTYGSVAVGYQAGYSTQSTGDIHAFGTQTFYQNTTGAFNTGVGNLAGGNNTTGSYNTALGYQALRSNTTASNNTAVGYQAGFSNTTGVFNNYFGSQAGYSNTTSAANNYFGWYAGQASTGSFNTFVGHAAGGLVTTGSGNTFIGTNQAASAGAGYSMTTGSKNVIIGGFLGNSGGLDIRTSNNYIVLSDGDGNPRQYYDQYGNASLAGAVSPSLNTDLGGSYTLAYGYRGTAHIAYAQANHIQTVNAYYQGGWKRGGSGASNYLQIANGAFIFSSADSGATDSAITWTEVLRVQKNQTIPLQGGATSVSGTGITFPATQNASSNANTLDDYEEGTFTTTIAGEANVSAVSLVVGNYIKIGKQVTLFVKFNFTVTSSNLYTYWNFTLPFTSDSANDNAGACVENNIGRIGGVTTYGSSTAAAYVIFPSAAQVPSGSTACYISYTYRANA